MSEVAIHMYMYAIFSYINMVSMRSVLKVAYHNAEDKIVQRTVELDIPFSYRRVDE